MDIQDTNYMYTHVYVYMCIYICIYVCVYYGKKHYDE